MTLTNYRGNDFLLAKNVSNLGTWLKLGLGYTSYTNNLNYYLQYSNTMLKHLLFILLLSFLKRSASVVPSAIEVLAEELTTTKNLIEQYQKKLSILQELHKSIKSLSNNNQKQSVLINNIVAQINERISTEKTCGVVGINSDISSSSRQSNSHSVNRYLAKQDSKKISGQVTTLQVLGIPQRGGGQTYRARSHTAVRTHDIVVLTHLDRTTKKQFLSMYNNVGEKLYSHPLIHHKAVVTHVATSLNARDPFVATGDTNGVVQLHNSTMYQLGRYVAGRMTPPRDPGTGRILLPDPDTWSKNGIQVKLSFEKEIFQTPDNSAVVAIGVKRARFNDMIAVADASGHLHMLLRNGSVAYKIFFDIDSSYANTNQQPIIGAMLLGRRAAPVVVAVGADLRFVLPPNVNPLPYKCKGTTDRITSIAKDCMRSQYLFAGTAAGDILVFDTTGTQYNRNRPRRQMPNVGARRGGFSRCTLIYKLPCSLEESQASSVQVFTVQGAVVAVSSSGDSVAYNTTEIWRSPPTLLWRGKHIVSSDDNANSSILLSGLTGVDGAIPLSNGATMVFLTQPNTLNEQQNDIVLTTHRMLLPYYEPVADSAFSFIASLRGPLIVMVIVCMFIYQIYSRKRGSPPSMAKMFGGEGRVPNFSKMGGRIGGGIGDGGRGMDPGNMDGLMQMLEKSGGQGVNLANELRQHQIRRT
jgi:hypothetical protein